MTLRRVLGLLGVVIVVGAGLGGGWYLRAQTQPDAARTTQSENGDTRPLPVVVRQIEQVQTFEQQRQFVGIVATRRTSTLGFERAGRLTEVLVDEGERVQSGQVLARLDQRHLRVEQRELRAQRAQAAAQLAEFQSGPRPQTIEASRAELTALRTQLQQLDASHRRNTQLRVKNAIPEQQFDDSLFALQAAQARVEAAAQRLEELEEGTRGEQIAAQQALVDGLDAQLENLELDLDDTVLTAPFAGTVSERAADEGTFVAAGHPVLTLVENGVLEARIGLTPATAAGLQLGQSVTVSVDDVSLNAQLRAVLPELDPTTRTQTAIFDFAPADCRRIVAGQVVRVELTERQRETGFWLPTTALSRSGRGLWSVFVATPQSAETAAGDRLRAQQPTGSKADSSRPEASRPRHQSAVLSRRDVEVLHTDGARVFVRGAVAQGDLVVTTGVHRIVPGQLVIPQSESAIDDNSADELPEPDRHDRELPRRGSRDE